jgi:hypothetical protein
MAIAVFAEKANLTADEISEVIIDLEYQWGWECGLSYGVIAGSGQGYLCSGETEEQFLRRCCKSVWKNTKHYVEVRIDATCLEDLPCDTHESDPEEFNKIMGI